MYCWFTTGGIEDGVHKSFANPVPYTDGHEAEHMIEMSSQTGLPNENGVQGTVTFEVIDPEWYKPLLMEHSYDPDTQSLMLMCGIYRELVDLSRPVYFSVRCLDGRSVMMDTETTLEEYEANYSPVYLADYGTTVLEAAETEFRSLGRQEPIRLVNPEDKGELEILDIRLSATCAEWKVRFDDVDRIWNNSTENPDFRELFEKQLQWGRFVDEILSGAFLTMDDGSVFRLMPSNAAPYEDGAVTLTSNWSSTIDIGRVKSITVMGSEYDFPQLGSEH